MKKTIGVLIADKHAAFIYLNRLGLAGDTKDTIFNKQQSLDYHAERMLTASGQADWWAKDLKPFRVRYNRVDRSFAINEG